MNEDLRLRRACKVIEIEPTLRAKIESSSTPLTVTFSQAILFHKLKIK